ncbi:MAG: YfiR family protein [Bacteroidetes bacterium]|nr:YfiR family protein [Bacteroidota bacterium]
MKKVILLWIMAWFCCNAVMAQDVDYRAQSLYIYKFSKYVFWPEETLQGEFKIGVYGNSPILEELQLMASLKKGANDLSIRVTEITEEDDLTDYHIIYIPSSKSRQIRDLTEKVGTSPVLLVAEREGLATKGATINFLITENMVLKFEVNMSKMADQNLKISPELLKLGYEI